MESKIVPSLKEGNFGEGDELLQMHLWLLIKPHQAWQARSVTMRPFKTLKQRRRIATARGQIQSLENGQI